MSIFNKANLQAQALQERWLAIGLLAGVVLIISLVIFVPLISKELELLEEKKALVFKLQQYERILANSDTIVDAGGQLSSTQALPVTNKDAFKRITVSVRMTGSSQVLQSVLYKIETSEPLIIINQLDIRPMRGTRNKVTRQIEDSNDLNVNFQAVSFMRKPA